MKETFVYMGGVYTTGLIIFHMLFWKIFRWPETLQKLSSLNRATMQVLNISITFIFVIFAYISFVHTKELISTDLGEALLVLMALLWVFRVIQQVLFYKLKNTVSIGLALYFLMGAALYGLPVVL